MPVVELHLLDGYSADEKRRLGEALTDAVRLVVPADPNAVTVMIREMAQDQFMRGRISRTADALPDPRGIVETYLAAMERRDLEAAEALLAPGFTMQFPGGRQMKTLSELIAWSRPRYKSVTKTFERFDVMQSEGAAAIVYCFGTLAGEWLGGLEFSGIRFIDRFELEGGKITRQDVWNDMAEVKART